MLQKSLSFFNWVASNLHFFLSTLRIVPEQLVRLFLPPKPLLADLDAFLISLFRPFAMATQKNFFKQSR